MERIFDNELNKLKEKILNTSFIVRDMIKDAITSLKNRDESLLKKIFENEEKVNLAQIEIDDIALKLIALHQPVASDLRFLISATKINSDLERIADLSINIAECTQDLLKEPPLKPLIDLPRMAEIVEGMLEEVINAFINKEPESARTVCKRDDLVDDLNDQIFRELITYMLNDPKSINRAIKLILVARHLERIADHATNIAEDIYYMCKGRDIRHHIEEKENYNL